VSEPCLVAWEGLGGKEEAEAAAGVGDVLREEVDHFRDARDERFLHEPD
jgi:hypothetical protein